MAGKPQDHPMIQNERAKRADGGEPLYDEEMSLYNNGGSVVVGVTSFACKVHSLALGDTVRVETYPDGIWIDVEGADEK
jgi:hypothetical protein